MNKIEVSLKKTLKLQNVLIKKLSYEEAQNLHNGLEIEKMHSVLKVNGAHPIGPLIQYSSLEENREGNMELYTSIILQSSECIPKVESPYQMEPVLKVSNCMYCRFIGPEEKLGLAYDKLQVVSFEEDISLKSKSYTIIVDRDEEKDIIVADIFMERDDA